MVEKSPIDSAMDMLTLLSDPAAYKEKLEELRKAKADAEEAQKRHEAAAKDSDAALKKASDKIEDLNRKQQEHYASAKESAARIQVLNDLKQRTEGIEEDANRKMNAVLAREQRVAKREQELDAREQAISRRETSINDLKTKLEERHQRLKEALG